MSLDTTVPGLTLCECYTITLSSGFAARFTDHPSDLTFLGETYVSIPIKRGEIAADIDLQAAEVQITAGIVGVTLDTEEYTIPQVVKNEFLRNAHVVIHRVDYTDTGNYAALFEGWVTGAISYDESAVTMGAGSLLDRLSDLFPRLIYSITCNHSLFDDYCGLDPGDYDEAGTAAAGSTRLKVVASVFGSGVHALGYFSRGRITGVSGANASISRSIREHKEGYGLVMVPFPNDITPGDTFTVWPGCDGMGQTCHEKFDNYANFFGFEEIPNPKILIG